MGRSDDDQRPAAPEAGELLVSLPEHELDQVEELSEDEIEKAISRGRAERRIIEPFLLPAASKTPKVFFK